jgi:Glycosyl transferase family 2
LPLACSGSQGPRITVVIPTHDRPSDLRRAIRTVRRQTLSDWELVIVDDGSPEPVTLDPDARDDHRITLIRHPSRLGVSDARNTGIAHAKAPWIAFLDDDDLWWPGKLAAQLAEATARGKDFVFTGRYTVDRAGKIISVRGPAPTENLTRTLLFRNQVGEPSTVMVRRDMLISAGGFDTSLSVIADWEMWVRLSCISAPLAMPDMTAAIVYHPNSMQMSQARRIPLEVEAMRQRHADLLAAEQMPLGSSVTELAMANRRLHGERSIASLIAYIRMARKHGQVAAIARRLAARKLRGIAAVPPQLAPAWVLEQLANPARP